MEDLSDLNLVSQSEGMTALEARSAVGVLKINSCDLVGQGKGRGVRLDTVRWGAGEYVDQLLLQSCPRLRRGLQKTSLLISYLLRVATI